MNILAIESSAVSASAAVVSDGAVLADEFLNAGLTHSQTLAPLAAAALKKAGAALFDMDLIAVTNGPGSFTGVRIGVSLAKGLATPAEIPCLGVSSLAAAAYRFRQRDGLIWAAMDARRGQIYTAFFRAQNGVLERLTQDDALTIDEAAERLLAFGSETLLCGDGAAVVDARLQSPDAPHRPVYTVPDGDDRFQHASDVALLAEYELLHTDRTPLAPKLLVPVYLRPSQAERELRSKNAVSQSAANTPV